MILALNIQGFDIGLPTTLFEWVVSALAIVSTFAVLVIVAIFVKYAGKGTVTFIKETLSDITGHGDIKFLLAFLITVFGYIPMLWLNFYFPKAIDTGLFWAVGLTICALVAAAIPEFMSGMSSGKVILKAEPPKDRIVNTNTSAEPAAPTPAEVPDNKL